MKRLILGFVLVAVPACKSHTNASIGDESGCCVPGQCHVTNQHRVCPPDTDGCCKGKIQKKHRSPSAGWAGWLVLLQQMRKR